MILSRHPDGKTPLIYLAVCCLFLSTCSRMTGPEESGLSVSPESLDFGIFYHTLSLTVSSSGGEPFQWRVSEVPEWLTVSPSAGTSHRADTSLQVSVTRSDLNNGDYTAGFTISSDGEDVTVPVFMKVDGPYLDVSASELQFGASLTTLSLVLTNIGNGVLEYQITTSAEWMDVSPTAGQIGSRSQEVEVTVDRADFSPGDYQAELLIQMLKRQVRVSVSMSIPPDG